MSAVRKAVGALYATPNTATASMTATGGSMPAHAAEDLLLMFCHFDTGATVNGSITAPAGWGDLGFTLGSAAASQLGKIFYKVATSSAETFTSPTFVNATTGTTGGTGVCVVVSYRGVDTSSMPSSALLGNGTALNQSTAAVGINSIPGFTPSAGNGLIVAFGGKSSASGSNPTGFSPLANAENVTWAEALDAGSTNAGDAWMVIDDGTQTTATAIAAKSFTQAGGSSSKAVGIMFALKSPVLAKVETLTDTFDTAIDAAKWNTFGANPPVIDTGRMKVTGLAAGTAYSGVESHNRFTLKDSYIYGKFSPAPRSGAHEYFFEVVKFYDGTNKISLFSSGTDFIARVATDGVNNNNILTYDPVTSQWWRIREGSGAGAGGAAGTSYVDTSPDGITWTNQTSFASPTWIGDSFVSISAGHWQVEAVDTVYYVDNIDTAPVVALPKRPLITRQAVNRAAVM